MRRLEEALSPIIGESAKEQLLEEFRRARLRELTRIEENGAAANLVQDRCHYLCATFRPVVPKSSPLEHGLRKAPATLKMWARGRRAPRSNGRWETTYEALTDEATRFARRVEAGLSQMGLGFQRCSTPEIVRLEVAARMAFASPRSEARAC